MIEAVHISTRWVIKGFPVESAEKSGTDIGVLKMVGVCRTSSNSARKREEW